MARIKIYSESNYKSVFSKGKTLRFTINDSSPIEKLPYPEFLDVDIFGFGGLCNGGCSYCYLSGSHKGGYVKDAVEKIFEYFGNMDEHDRPFQVALPGSGEGYLHPDFLQILTAFNSLKITPNYTTNGMWVKEKRGYIERLMEATRDFCGGVAVTCHPHLESFWTVALRWLKNYGIKTNIHVVISDRDSVDYFYRVFNQRKDYFDSCVLLPYGAQGRAKYPKDISWDYLMETIKDGDMKKVSFGANFYPYIIADKSGRLDNLSLYDEKTFSGFLDLSNMKMHESSWSYA